LALPAEALKLPRNVFAAWMFAHEIGHAAQRTRNFAEHFHYWGGPYIDPLMDYEAYVNSAPETNADFVAATIVSTTEFGRANGITSPDQGPTEWLQWAKEHPVDKTIQAFGSVSVKAS
jgi:hypothetical protein